jgi:hypothetical protein
MTGAPLLPIGRLGWGLFAGVVLMLVQALVGCDGCRAGLADNPADQVMEKPLPRL